MHRLGLVQAFGHHLLPLQVHFRYPLNDHVPTLTYNVLLAPVSLLDVKLRRQDQSFLNGLGAEAISDRTSAKDFTRRFSLEDILTVRVRSNRM